jgi:hypothetical protein
MSPDEAPVTFTCPKTEIKYRGMCPVLKCPSNISHVKRNSGCLHNFLDGKIEIGVHELAYAFKKPVKEVKANIADGEEKIKRVLLLSTLLIQTRARAKLTHCPKCGVLRSTVGPCMRVDQCNARLAVVLPLLSKLPLNIPELGFTKEDLFRLLNDRLKVNKFLATLDTDDKKIRLKGLLSLTKREYSALRELRTIV